MTSSSGTVLEMALRQLGELMGGVTEANAGDPTPCTDWTVAQLSDHIVHVTGNFAQVFRGEKVDWTAAAPTLDGDRAAAFDTVADRLRQAAAGAPEDTLGMPCAELGVHTWDLATALGAQTAGFDARVADVGYAMLQANLTDDARGGAFAPAVSPPAGADAYTRLAAFAGRSV